ncbi:zinc metalloproteinase-disintegrin-like kaouthiagin-like [Leptopilina boulardi]|uniref:zinc metalloproteinase-disintegrin-like kaouthiagin-like n=1 Tax=Leptopilina boulardi TaxID=63433 RepID=UPI0021F65665|nr:zinc metalloproteinase-disintegrin-like kaouthiagin-like [Leptopilina boulardi]
MFLKFIIFCSLFLSFTQCYKLSNNITYPDTLSRDGEVFNYNNNSVKPKINCNKETITEMFVKTKIKGIEENYILQSDEGYFAGEQTKVWLANTKDNDTMLSKKLLDYTLQENIMKEVNISFYQDRKNFIVENEKEDLEFTDDSNSSMTTDNDNIIKERILTIEKYYVNKYLNRTWEVMKESTLGVPDTVYPEILVFVHNSIFRQFNEDVKKTVAYILTLFNGVDLLFRSMKTPKIRLNIAGIVILQFAEQTPFIVDIETLERFNTFLYHQSPFKIRENYDIAVLIGGNPLYNFYSNNTGIATEQGGACTDFIITGKIVSTFIVFDDTMFSGISDIAHELAHLFGVYHDGMGTGDIVNGPGAEKCNSGNYIMTTENSNGRSLLFSKCSEEMMSFFFSREDANCLRNNPAVNRKDKQILRILPAKFMTINEQCHKLGFHGAFIRENRCESITCYMDAKTHLVLTDLPLFPPEGIACNSNMYCIKGKCTQVINENNIDLNLFFPPSY